jgi:hypothetical protein
MFGNNLGNLRKPLEGRNFKEMPRRTTQVQLNKRRRHVAGMQRHTKVAEEESSR